MNLLLLIGLVLAADPAPTLPTASATQTFGTIFFEPPKVGQLTPYQACSDVGMRNLGDTIEDLMSKAQAAASEDCGQPGYIRVQKETIERDCSQLYMTFTPSVTVTATVTYICINFSSPQPIQEKP